MKKNDQITLTGPAPEIEASPDQHTRRKIPLPRTMISIAMLIIIGTLTACSSATATTNATTAPMATSAPQDTPTTAATLAPTATSVPTQAAATSAPQAAATNSPQQTTTTQLDPCTLISSQEASSLVGVSFGQGVEASTPEGLKMCKYSSQSSNIFIVDVIEAPDVATAQSYKAKFLSDLQSNMQQLTSEGLNVTQLPGFADGAVKANANADVNGISFSDNAFGFLKGKVYLGFSDLSIGGKAPSDQAMQAEAAKVLAMLP